MFAFFEIISSGDSEEYYSNGVELRSIVVVLFVTDYVMLLFGVLKAKQLLVFINSSIRQLLKNL